jgi:[acyl-carrier-protein] S-malonyltransferase
VIAAIFPGQGSQALGMAQEFYRHSAAARQLLDQAEAALPGLLKLMWEGPAETLQLTANQQPALVAAGAAAYAAYREAGGAAPSFAAGHSLGEFTAHVAAGSLELVAALRLVRQRGLYMQEAVPAGQGAMAAIMKAGREVVEQLCAETEGVVEIANLNHPEQTVISGEARAVLAAGERLQQAGARVVPLKVSAPFHCRLMAPAADRLAHDLAVVNFKPPAFPIVCNVTAEALTDSSQASALLLKQVTAPVRWVESVARLYALGVRRFIEFGSGKVLSGLVSRIVPDAEVKAVVDMASLQEVL